jgi:tetratricopeptide (TPR) repeat protein
MTELTIDQALQQGVEAHKAGQVQEADRLYTAILKAQPKHPDANHNMGVLAVGVGKVEQALPFFKTALEANPATAQFWLSYIDTLIKLERLTDAKAVLDQAKSKGAKGDGFDKLDERLKETNKEHSSDDTGIESLGANQSSALGVAIQLRELGKFNQAIDLLKNEINQSSDDVDTLAVLSHCYLLADQVDLAKLHLNRATTIAHDNALVGWNTARLTLKEQKPLEALNVARDTSQRFPDDVEGMGVLGACLRANGEADESLEILNRAIELNPNYAEALVSRGLIRLSKENKPEAVADLELAHRLKPHIKQIWDLVIGLKIEVQKYSDAILLLINMIEIDPNWEKGFSLLAACNQKADDSALAVESFEKVLAVKPGSAATHVNLGVALKKQGETKTAITHFKKALAIKPDYADAYYNIGTIYADQGKLEKAIAVYNQAIAIEPDYAEAFYNMGVILQEQGKLEEAIEAYTKALAIKPDHAEAYSNMGVTLQEQGKLEEAIEAYNKALAIKPNYADAWSNGAEALEKWNKLEQLDLWLERAFQILEPVPSDINFMKSKLLWRNKDKQGAIKIISNIDFGAITSIRKRDYLNLKAKCCEASKDYDLAFNCFKDMNEYATKSKDYLTLDPESYFQNIKDQLTILNSNSSKNLVGRVTEQTDVVPVFLVGFPRSGTTLLDTILRSHSSIDVVEEQPAVRSALEFIQKSGFSAIEQALPQEVLVGARKAYITELIKHTEYVDNKSILIDKLPLNLLEIPLIRQLYPRAKFILALRHPLDTILSCWMQNFKLNPAMANMVDLARTVEFFCLSMETFKICKTKYNLNVHQIKYEDVLENFRGEISALLEFLDLGWEDQMENYQKTALNRGRINTPSYSQVVQPIYQDSKYRWLNYENHLKQYITQVQPWINEFGYSKY